jgi:hypothetical protein
MDVIYILTTNCFLAMARLKPEQPELEHFASLTQKEMICRGGAHSEANLCIVKFQRFYGIAGQTG